MMAFISLLLLLLSSYLFTQLLHPKSRVEILITLFCLVTAQIIMSANILSYFHRLDKIGAWVLIGILFLILSTLLVYFQGIKVKSTFSLDFSSRFPFTRKWLANLTLLEKSIFIPLIGFVIIIGIMNLYLVFNLAPGNHDSMTSHLARVAYYLQQGSYEFYQANFWGQVVHPRNSTSLFLYSYVVTGSENLTQLVQYISYWITLLSIYGISTKAGMSRNQSLFSALVGGLLISVLMQSTTTQNDLLLTAYIGSIVYYFFTFLKSGNKQHLALATLAISISLGIKASILLAMVPVSIIAVWIFNKSGNNFKTKVRYYLFTAVAFLISFILFTLPSGYLFNIQKFGHPLGPELVRVSHTFESESPGYIIENGIRNTARYAVEFLSLDGLPTVTPVRKAQKRIRGYSQEHYDKYVQLPEYENYDPDLTDKRPSIEYTGNRSWIHYLMESQGSRAQFNYFKMPATNEDFSYWGIFGFALVWPLLFYSLFSKKSSEALKILALSTIIFFLLQAFAGPYDPWRGRYFNIAVIFALPSTGLILTTNYDVIKAYLLAIIFGGLISALSGTILKSGYISEKETYDNSINNEYTFEFLFTKNRIAQLTRLGPYYEPLLEFNAQVPSDASVAVYLPGDSFEYPLFGKNYTRTLYPINSFINGVQPIPEDAEYLLYSENYPSEKLENDILLGKVLNSGWYLRTLEK